MYHIKGAFYNFFKGSNVINANKIIRLYIAIILVFSFHMNVNLFGEFQGVVVHELEVNECLMPQDHPLQSQFKDLFQDRHMFLSLSHLKKCGFTTLSYKRNKIMVARHPDIKHYLIKKFCDVNFRSKEEQLNNYLKRITGARALQEFINLNQLKHIVVPQKWLYELPNQFSNAKTGEKSYVLIVEDMNIYTFDGKKGGKTARKYYSIEYDILKELCTVVYFFRGLDSGPYNLAFTRQNKIAFIDTEYWDEWDREGLLGRLLPYLGPNRKKYAMQVFKELCGEDIREEVCKECRDLE